MQNKKQGWTKTMMTVKNTPTYRIDALGTIYDVHIGDYGRVYTRKKRVKQLSLETPKGDFAHQSVNTEPVKEEPKRVIRVVSKKAEKRIKRSRRMGLKRLLKWWLRLEVFIIVWGLLWGYYGFTRMKPIKYMESYTLNKVRFTEEELKSFKERVMNQSAEAKSEPKAVKKEVKSFDADKMKSLISEKFAPYGKQMLICMGSENGTFQPDRKASQNKNGSWDFGLMRVNSIHCWGRLKSHNFQNLAECGAWLEIPENNVNTSREIFDGREYGFTPWYGKSCKQFYGLRTK